jgi:hypothetical protein
MLFKRTFTRRQDAVLLLKESQLLVTEKELINATNILEDYQAEVTKLQIRKNRLEAEIRILTSTDITCEDKDD